MTEKGLCMFPTAPTLFGFTVILAVAIISTVGLSVLWGIFAATLAVTSIVAIDRAIPRKER